MAFGRKRRARKRREREAQQAAAAASAERQRQIELEAQQKLEALKREQERIAAEKAAAELASRVAAEDAVIQEKAQTASLAAKSGLNRLNQLGIESDKQIALNQAGVISTLGKNTGAPFDLSKQQQEAQRSVGAAMSGSPSVTAFAAKAASVSPFNTAAQTANTGALKGAQSQNLDAAIASKAANAIGPSAFKLPSTSEIQIGDGKIQNFGGS